MGADWKQVSDELSGLALKLKMHFEQAESSSTKEEVKNAVGKLGDAVTEAFAAMRNAVSDPAVKDDVKDVGAALRDALYNTFSQVSAEVRSRFSRDEDSDDDDAAPAADTSDRPGTSGTGAATDPGLGPRDSAGTGQGTAAGDDTPDA